MFAESGQSERPRVCPWRVTSLLDQDLAPQGPPLFRLVSPEARSACCELWLYGVTLRVLWCLAVFAQFCPSLAPVVPVCQRCSLSLILRGFQLYR